MPTIVKLLPVGLIAAVLAGCASTAGIDGQRVAGGATTASATPSPRAVTSTSPAGCGVDSPCGSDDPRPPGPPPPAPVTGVDACTLVTQHDLLTVTAPEVQLEFKGAPTDEPPHVEAATGRGVTSFCRQLLLSHFTDHHGEATYITTVGGEVDVRVQSDGASLYFPVRSGDTPVTGLGAEAMVRYTALYVHLADGRVLIIQVGISSPGDDVRQIHAQDIEWAKELAAIAIGRL